MDVDVLGRRELPAVLADWDRLHSKDDRATPFTSPGWAQAWLDEWEPSVDAWIVCVRDRGEVVGIAPFAMTRRGPMRVLRTVGQEPGDYWDIVAEPALRERVAAAVGSTLDKRRNEWDAALIRCLPADSSTLRSFAGAGLRIVSRKPVISPGFALPATFDAYLGSLPGKRRSDIRRHLRWLDDGKVQLRDVRAPAEVPAAILRWQDVRSRQWRERGREIARSHETERFRRFMTASAQRLIPPGHVRIWEFWAGERMLGSYVNYVDERSFYSYLGGFEPDVAHLALGKIATVASIRSSIEEGRSYFDFARGPEEYKYWYGATDRVLGAAVVGHRGPRSSVAIDFARGVKAYRGLRGRRRRPDARPLSAHRAGSPRAAPSLCRQHAA
jgi:CelD/BcsL family acetyltransferase involved in cellulose biosynthesis